MTEEELELLREEGGKSPTTQMKEYLRSFEQRQKKSNTISLIFTIIGAVASAIAAVASVIACLS